MDVIITEKQRCVLALTVARECHKNVSIRRIITNERCKAARHH